MSHLWTKEQIFHFENMILLPMVLTVLQKDYNLVDTYSFKFKRPYQELIEQAIKSVEEDFRITRAYIKRRSYQVLKIDQDDFATNYQFYHDGYEDKRKYMNIHLRNRTEGLIREYLEKGQERLSPQLQ